MQYRALPHGGEKISIIGLGMGSIHRASVEETERTVRTAIDAGINYLDFIPSEAVAFEGYARALRGQREKVMLQVHLGASYSTGTYGFTTDPKVARREFEVRLRSLDTDYADFGFIHCIDARAVHPVCARPTWRADGAARSARHGRPDKAACVSGCAGRKARLFGAGQHDA